jgi:hypothetical protein
MSAALSKLAEPETATQDVATSSPTRLPPSLAETRLNALAGDRLLAFEALQLLMRLDRDLREARAQWSQDWFRRVMHARSRAVSRLRRRWEKIERRPAISLGCLRRRFHANLASIATNERNSGRSF